MIAKGLLSFLFYCVVCISLNSALEAKSLVLILVLTLQLGSSCASLSLSLWPLQHGDLRISGLTPGSDLYREHRERERENARERESTRAPWGRCLAFKDLLLEATPHRPQHTVPIKADHQSCHSHIVKMHSASGSFIF